ncbi:MAG: hypothetical protein ACLGIV_14085 [Actinomycetes bacterium]
MNDDSPDPAVRCPSCGARNLTGASWCSLCFVPFGAQAPPVTDEVPADLPRRRGRRAATPAADEVPAGEVPAGEVPQPAAPAVDALLAELAVHERQPSRLAGVSGLLSSPGARVVVMLLGTVVVTAGGFGLMAVIGSLL